MSYIDDIMKRAHAAKSQASETHQQTMEESRMRVKEMKKALEKPAEENDAHQCADDTQRQVEIPGQSYCVDPLSQLESLLGSEDDDEDEEEGSNPMEPSKFAQVFNYIIVDDINHKPMTAFSVGKSKKKKGLFAPKVEIIYLEPGHYEITAHGKTYQTSPAVVSADLEAGKYYCLGAAEDGLYCEERPYEWTL